MISLALRSLLWTILLPGFFAGYLPWQLWLRDLPFDHTNPIHVIGSSIVAVGVVLLAACIFEFARSGRGTLSPLDPPRHLVVRGLYRYVRNPMYLAVTTIILGEMVLTRSAGLAAYWLIWFTAVNLFVIGYEEPTLRDQFGESYEAYTRQVDRWLPKLPH